LLKLTEGALLDLKKKNLLENLNTIVGCDEHSNEFKENHLEKSVINDKKSNNIEDVVGALI
jgi:hypothetical protein